ncbi:hypothetical protein ACVWYG_003593, partial [Pedobacter sp. UYEF25]
YFYKFDDKLLLFKHRRMPFPSLAQDLACVYCSEILFARNEKKDCNGKRDPLQGHAQKP